MVACALQQMSTNRIGIKDTIHAEYQTLMWGNSYHAPSDEHQMLPMWYSVVVVSIIWVVTEYIERCPR